MKWNNLSEPISDRLRDSDQLEYIIQNRIGIYNPREQRSGIITEVFVVEPENHSDDDDYEFFSNDEDRWVEYITDLGPTQDFSVDLDDEGWLWLDELKK